MVLGRLSCKEGVTYKSTALKKKRKQLKELEEHRDKLQEYDCHLETGTEIWEKENDYQQSSQNGGSR